MNLRTNHSNQTLAITVVFVFVMLGNTLFNRPMLLLCLIYFIFITFWNNYKIKNSLSLPSISLIQSLLFKCSGIILLEVWAALSISWSYVPKSTMDLVSVQFTLMFLVILIAHNTSDEYLGAILKRSSYFVIVCVVLYCILFHRDSISPDGLKAFYANKNTLGRIMAFCTLIILFATKLRWYDYFIAFVSISLLYLSQSKTSFNLLLLIVFLVLLFKIISLIHKQLSLFTQGFIRLLIKAIPAFFYSLILIMIIYCKEIANYLMLIIPEDLFTGRGSIWITVLSRTKDDLLWGIGPGSFWESGRASEIIQTPFFAKNPIWVEHLAGADGGYIDITGSLGFIGLSLLFISFIQNYKMIFKTQTSNNSTVIFALLTFFIMHNITESTAYFSTNLLWFNYLFLSFYLATICKEPVKNRH